ncbi:MAG: hypothetical protein NZM43_11510, partial [Saprospiraceae bacterium]|nr:hypothetical protein [Saprospiraceae bacterium]MDW8484935.1 hypothetical protein [Saprospiraceae bacterium]
MTIKNILFALLWPITYASYGQGTTFNIVKALPYPQVDFSHIVLHNDTIVGYGTGFNDDIHWKQGVAVVKVDTFGNVLAHNFILDAKGDLLATSKAWGNIIRTSDSGYAAIAATVYRKSAFLIKLSHDLQVEFIKEYPDTVNRSNYFYKILETLEGYLLYGSIQRPDYYDDGFIRYVDKQGETVWFKYFEFSKFSTTVVHIQKIKDSTYIASFVSSSNKQEDIGFSSFMIFNLTSNEIMELGLWHFSIDSPVGINRRVIVTEGAILVFGLYRVSVINNVPIYRPILVRLDDSFRPVWV